MGMLDRFKDHRDELKDKAADLASTHGDKIASGINKAADLASKASDGKYDSKIQTAAVKAKDAANKLGNSK